MVYPFCPSFVVYIVTETMRANLSFVLSKREGLAAMFEVSIGRKADWDGGDCGLAGDGNPQSADDVVFES